MTALDATQLNEPWHRAPRRCGRGAHQILHLCAFGEGERILYIDSQIANSTLDLRVAEQDLHGAQVTCLLIDDGCLGSARRMGSVILRTQSDPGHPLVNKSSILPSADMIGVIDTAREDELVKRAASAFEPGQNAAAGGLKELELNGPAGLLLADGRAGPNPTAPYKGPHLDLHQRTPRPVHISSRV